MFNDYNEYKVYKDFCEQRPTFCYCDYFSCEFKTSSSTQYTNGVLVSDSMSKETLELCDLATKLNDKETLFKVGCK